MKLFRPLKMTPNKDIIEQTKELLEWYKEAKDDDCEDIYAKWSGYAADSFPEVARSLITAVEALEELTIGSDHYTQQKAKDTLHTIRNGQK